MRRGERESEEVVTLHLTHFDSHGTARAPFRSRQIEVEHGIPGETVRATVVGRPEKSKTSDRRLRARIVEVLEPSPDRVVPPCPYFREWQCGGCQWQHISYEGQVERKRKSVETEMQARNLPFAVDSVHTLDVPWRYRSTAGISLGKRAGFRRHGSLAIVPIRDCPIAHPLIGQLMAALNDRIDEGAVPDFRGRLRLEVRLAEAEGEDRLQILVRPGEDSALPPNTEVSALVAAVSRLDGVGGVSILQADGSIATASGDLFAPLTVAGRRVWLTAGSFFQTNLRLLPTLIARLQQEAEPRAKRIADVYGGIGLFGLFLADEAERVTVIESDRLAIAAGERTAAEWRLHNVRFVATPAEEALLGPESFDVVVLDPPRSGLSEPVTAGLLQRRPPTVLYVSCLARSLARDLVLLTDAGYRVDHLELFDFYPQTYHIEMLAVLRLP